VTRNERERRSGWLWLWIALIVIAILVILLWAWPAQRPPPEVGTDPVSAVRVEAFAGPATAGPWMDAAGRAVLAALPDRTT
jgi:hypothetical protein